MYTILVLNYNNFLFISSIVFRITKQRGKKSILLKLCRLISSPIQNEITKEQ